MAHDGRAKIQVRVLAVKAGGRGGQIGGRERDLEIHTHAKHMWAMERSRSNQKPEI